MSSIWHLTSIGDKFYVWAAPCDTAELVRDRVERDPWPSFTDTCYVLSFAIIMLNTSLHNPNVRDKPPVERFISMNRGINEGGDLPEELLRVRGLSAPARDRSHTLKGVLNVF